MKWAKLFAAIAAPVLLSACMTGLFPQNTTGYTIRFGTMTGSDGAYRVRETTTVPYPCGEPRISHGLTVLAGHSDPFTSYIRIIPPSSVRIHDDSSSRSNADNTFVSDSVTAPRLHYFKIQCGEGKVLGEFDADDFFGTFEVELYINNMLYYSIRYDVLEPNT